MSHTLTHDIERELKRMELFAMSEPTPSFSSTSSMSAPDLTYEIDKLMASISGEDDPFLPPPPTQHLIGYIPEYQLSDDEDSSTEANEDEIYESDPQEIHGKTIPDWARSDQLLKSLKQQQSIDPELIFGQFDNTCDLNQMFSTKKRSFKVRGDSSWWTADSVTPAEDSAYKMAMGLVTSNLRQNCT